MNTYYKIWKSLCVDSNNSLDEVELDVVANELIQDYGYVIPSDSVIKRIEDSSKDGLIEMAAGRGYWASLLNPTINVYCFDAYVPSEVWTDVKEGVEEDLKDFVYPGYYNLMILSPPYRTNVVLDCLRLFKGPKFLFAGDLKFSLQRPSIKKELEENWEEVYKVSLPNWPGQDNWFFEFERK